LHALKIPGPTQVILEIFRILLAIYTFGISLLFWRKSAAAFDYRNFIALKTILKQNIALLKLSAAGSTDLLNRIKIFEAELLIFEKKLKLRQISKYSVLTIVIAFFVYQVFFIEHPEKAPVSYKILPNDTLVDSIYKNFVTVVNDTFVVTNKFITNNTSEYELAVKLKLTAAVPDSLKQKAGFELIICEPGGLPYKPLKSGTPDYDSKKNITGLLISEPNTVKWITFRISENFGFKNSLDSLKPGLIQFYINTTAEEKPY